MSTTKLAVEKREVTGSAACRRLRRAGSVPGNLYGHGGDPITISTAVDNIYGLLNSGSRVIDVELNGEVQKALFKEIQWDSLGSEIQHVDFMRIDAKKRMDVEAPIEIRGISPGVTAGGSLEQATRRLEINCLAVEVPNSIVVRISALQLDETIYAKDLELPTGAELLTPPDVVIVHCAIPSTEEEQDEEAPAEPAEVDSDSSDN